MAGDRTDLGILMAVAYGGFVDELRAQLARDGFANLHPSFGHVVRQLAAGPITLRQLADRLGLTSQGALKIVDEMEADGYVERVADSEDARSKQLHLTRRGQAALGAARAFHRKFEAGLARELGARDVATLRAVLTHLVARYGGDADHQRLRPM